MRKPGAELIVIDDPYEIEAGALLDGLCRMVAMDLTGRADIGRPDTLIGWSRTSVFLPWRVPPSIVTRLVCPVVPARPIYTVGR